jgi:hypothetical protein
MTYHDNNRPHDLSPDARPYGRGPRRTGLGWMLGLVALLILGGLALMMLGREDNVATRPDQPATTTTGSGSTAPAPAARDMGTGTNPPAANTPTPAPAPKQ